MAFRLSKALNNDIVNTMLLNIAGAAGSVGTGTLSIYTGAQPATPDSAATGTLLVVIEDICWSAVFEEVEAHGASIDVDNGGGNGVITADVGTPYADIPVGSVIVLTGTTANDGTYEVASIGGGGSSITCTDIIAGGDDTPSDAVISPVKAGIATLVDPEGYSAVAIESGLAGWARLESSAGDGSLVVDGDVGADFWNVFTINSATVATDQVITLLNADIFMV